MTVNRDLFSDFEEKDLQQSIEFGDDERYNTTRIGTVSFQRKNGSHIRLAYVLYVPDLRKNIVSVAVLEDCGYEVMFRKGNFFLEHIATGQVKQISSRVKNLYALEVEDACKALRRKAVVSDLVVEREKLSLNMQPHRQS